MAEVERTPDPATQGDGTGDDNPTMVPLKGLQDEREKRQAAEQRAARAEGQLQGLQAQTQEQSKQEEPAREYTRAELTGFVDEGRISQVDADRILDDQQSKRIERTVRDVTTQTISEQTTAHRLSEDLNEYKRLVPDVMVSGSEARARVEKEYAYLTSIGEPEGVMAELKSLRSVYGPLDGLRAVSVTGKRETYNEVGGGGGVPRDSRGQFQGGGLPDGIAFTSREKAYYTGLLDKGMTTTEKIKKEMSRADPELRQQRADQVYQKQGRG